MINNNILKNFSNSSSVVKQSSDESTYFVITVDTESDDAWENPNTIKLENLNAIPRFQDLCEKYEIIPTYLITYECATRDEAIKILKPILDRGKCEIGHHLHVWSTPPFKNDNGKGVDLEWLHAYQSELPDNLFFEKAEILHSVIKQNYEIEPTSHRAGRWGIDDRTIQWLTGKNYLVDSSVVPLFDFSQIIGISKGGPNFFFESFDTLKLRKDDKYFFEIPVTVNDSPHTLIQIVKFGVAKGLFSTRNAHRIIRKFGGGSKLTPSLNFTMSEYDKTIKKMYIKGSKIINFALHSSELSPNHSPITKTSEGYEYFWQVLDQSFSLIKSLNIKSLALSKAAKSIYS